MVFICFFGIKKDNFRIGRTILPKFFMEDLGFEGFEVVRRCGRKVGVSELPRVMVEGFLKDYLDVDCVFGKDLKVVCGYFVGMMEDETTRTSFLMKDVFGDMKSDCHLIGFGTSNKILDHQLFSLCKEIYLASKADKRRWRALPRDKYPKPLIFHDEGTTCREPYVLRFSPLFAEISNDFIPVALDAKVSMFYGTTASGFKFLDPLFFVLNPTAIYHIKILENLLDANIVEQSRIEIANRVQKQIAEALGFQCTNLTRRDKYMVLAGNEGVV
ncbi:putative glycerol-3-phosphate 1-O-acyltransferase [Helianthus annuus]|nr:putative glycerol-3-phosphate 1-O-acyltransferase [Helianthus annuus]